MNWVNCPPLKLLSLTITNVARPSRRDGPNVIPSMLSIGMPRSSKANTSRCDTGVKGNWRTVHVKGFDAQHVRCALCRNLVDHDNVSGAAAENTADRERSLHHQAGPDIVDRQDFDDPVHSEDRRRFRPRCATSYTYSTLGLRFLEVVNQDAGQAAVRECGGRPVLE